MTLEEKKNYLTDFADKYDIKLEEKGECGFGRPCVGLIKNDNYIDYNPLSLKTYELLFDEDERLEAPEGVEAYHKHNCLAVLVHDDDYNAGIEELYKWIKHLESQGEIYIEKYPTGADQFQAMVSGAYGHAIRLK